MSDGSRQVIGEFRLTHTWPDDDRQHFVLLRVEDELVEVAVVRDEGRWPRCDDRQ